MTLASLRRVPAPMKAIERKCQPCGIVAPGRWLGVRCVREGGRADGCQLSGLKIMKPVEFMGWISNRTHEFGA